MNAEKADDNMNDFKYSEVADKIIKAFFTVYNALGHGFLEKVYVNALMIELKKLGLLIKVQTPINVLYENTIIGEYFADIIVQDCVIVEVKAIKNLTAEHEAQLLNYLKATKMEVGLLLNFGHKPELKRLAFSHAKR